MSSLRDNMARRVFLEAGGLAFGSLALAGLDGAAARGETIRETGSFPNHPPKAKSIIYLQMLGGPSQLDLFDYKPKLGTLHGQDVPASVMAGEKFAFIRGQKKFLGTPYKFERRGQCGAFVSDQLPHLAKLVDEMAIVKSVQTDQFNHGPAQIFLNTGFATMGRPSLGSWISYGLGSESQNLPGYIVLVPGMRNSGGKGMWGAGFLPSRHQGVEFRVNGEAVPFAANPLGVSSNARKDSIEAVRSLNRLRQAQTADPQIAGSIASYEMAFRMQSSVPDLMDLTREPKSVLDLYGVSTAKTNYARCCLLARRMVERGVRFIQICYEGEPGLAIWDSHGDTRRASLEVGLPYLCKQMDQPTAALLMDLQQRGLLEETIVVWGGEFGRTPMNEDRPGAEKGYTGRDHWPKAGVMWLAGGGVQKGVSIGATDELGFHVVEDPVHVHDLNATLLHLLGVDHLKLTHRFQGRDFRLTDVGGKVVKKLLA